MVSGLVGTKVFLRILKHSLLFDQRTSDLTAAGHSPSLHTHTVAPPELVGCCSVKQSVTCRTAGEAESLLDGTGKRRGSLGLQALRVAYLTKSFNFLIR
jgi:hypothetical protein